MYVSRVFVNDFDNTHGVAQYDAILWYIHKVYQISNAVPLHYVEMLITRNQ